MLYKAYGSTGKKISAVSFGAMRFDNPTDIDANADIVLHAYRQGINYFDTAPYYCDDQSEDIVGAAARQMKPGTFYLSTKCSSSSGDELRKSLERSLQRLGAQRIDVFHIWCVLQPEQWRQRKSGGAVAAALKAKEEGLISHVAISSHMAGEDIAEVLAEGVVEGVTLGYSAINFPYRQKALDAAGKAKVGVVAMNPLAGGLIAWNAERFDFLKAADDADVVSAAIRFVISQPAITSALVGFTTKAHVDQAVAGMANFKPYAAAHMEAVKRRIESSFDGLCTGCGYCLPCPQGVEIPKLMDAYNHKILKGEPLADRLRWHWDLTPAAAEACTGCGACLEKCTQHLPIVERLKEMANTE
jgi:uncharacterized protein